MVVTVYLFLLIIFGLLESSSSYQQNITVVVSESGLDYPSCVHNGMPCNTMTFALHQISQLSTSFPQSTEIIVYVNYNQTINSSFEFLFMSSYPLSIKVVGQDYAFIKLDQSSTLHVFQPGPNREFYWAWIGLGFIRKSGDDITESYTEMLHNYVTSLAILNCRIMTTQWVIRETQKLVIDRTEFGRYGFCPIFYAGGSVSYLL